jgi:hypothetical protein
MRRLIRLGNRLARVCGTLGRLLAEAERRLKRCEDCGRSRFYGKPCMGDWE